MIAIIVFLLGWVFVSLGTSAGLMDRVSELTKPEGVTRAQPTQLSPMLYSLDVLLPIHGFGQEVNWWPVAEDWRWCFCWPAALPWGYLLRLWLAFEIAAGWMLTGFIVAGFAGIVRRE